MSLGINNDIIAWERLTGETEPDDSQDGCQLEPSSTLVKYRPLRTVDQVLETRNELLFVPLPAKVTEDDIQSAFEEKFPSRSPELTRVAVRWRSYWNENRDITVEVVSVEEQCYRGSDIDVAVALAKRFGSIKTRYCLKRNQQELWDAGCYLLDKLLIYDPKIAARKKSSEVAIQKIKIAEKTHYC